MTFLLDTSVFSQPLRNRPSVAVLSHWQTIGDQQCSVSVVTISEVEWGLHYEGNPLRWKKYAALLENRLNTLPTSDRVWSLFAKMKARQQTLGEPVSDLDLLIAATAKSHAMTVATLNRNDFSRIEGIAWEDWGSYPNPEI